MVKNVIMLKVFIMVYIPCFEYKMEKKGKVALKR